jgi:hypothetical protein
MITQSGSKGLFGHAPVDFAAIDGVRCLLWSREDGETVSQVQDPELSLLGTQLDELQALLERRLDEERQTRQQTLVGLERWISDRLAERDRAITARLAEVAAVPVVSAASLTPTVDISASSFRNDAIRPNVVAGEDASLAPDVTSEELIAEVNTLRDRVASLEAQLAFIGARQDEFTVLLATVREWVVNHP